MKHLTVNYWNKFQKDGILFEKFIKELLSIIYPNKEFTPTSQTHDGGKDIVSKAQLLFGDEINLWMECKYHKDKLSFHDISSTLLMAFLEDAKQLLIFSYSPINQTFLDYIAKYRDKTKISVKIYDDEALEQLILLNANKFENFEDYFPEFLFDNKMLQSDFGDLTFDFRISTKNSIPYNMPIHLDINEEIDLELYVTNSSFYSKSFTTALIHESLSEYFELLYSDKKEKNHNIEANSSCVFSFKIRIKKFRKNLKLPRLTVFLQNDKKVELTIKRSYKCRWLAETELIGDTYTKSLKIINDYLSTDLNSSIIILKGASGTGKSRLLKEIAFCAVKLNKRVFHFDADLVKHNSKVLLKSLISHLDKIPDVGEDFAYENIIIGNENSKNKLLAFNILYNKNFNISQNIDSIVEYIKEILLENNISIIIDNVQDLDEEAITILEKLIEYFKTMKCNSSIILSFNSSKMYRSSHQYQFCKSLELLSYEMPKQLFFKIINGFSKEDAQRYVELSLSNNQSEKNFVHKNTAKTIVDRIGTNPFYIRNYLIYLYQSSIIQRSDLNFFYVLDFEAFNSALKNLPSNISTLIEKRERLFLENVEDSNKYINFFYTLSLFGNISYEFFFSMFDKECLENLLDSDFVTCINNEKITFAHKIYQEYFTEKYSLFSFPKDLSEQILSVIETEHKIDTNLCPCFVLKHLTNTLDLNIFNKTVDIVINNHIESFHYLTIFKLLDNLIINNAFDINPNIKMKLYSTMHNISIYKYGIESALTYISTIYNDFCSNPMLFVNTIEELFGQLKDYLTNLLNIGKYELSLKKNEKILKILDKYISDSLCKQQMMIQLYNCQAMAYHHMDKTEKALERNNYAIERSQKIDDIMLLSTSWRVRGNIYYHSSKAMVYSEQVCECWEKAYSIVFETNNNYRKYDVFFSLSTCLKFILVKLIKNDFYEIEPIVEYVSSCFNKTNSLYHEINLRLIKSIYLLKFYDSKLIFDTETKEDIQKIIAEAIDLSSIYGNYNYYASGFYIKGLLSYIIANYTDAYDDFATTLNIINQNASLDAEIKWKNIVSDIYNLFNHSNFAIPIQLKCIFKKYNIGITENYEEYKSQAILTTKDNKLCFPKLF